MSDHQNGRHHILRILLSRASKSIMHLASAVLCTMLFSSCVFHGADRQQYRIGYGEGERTTLEQKTNVFTQDDSGRNLPEGTTIHMLAHRRGRSGRGSIVQTVEGNVYLTSREFPDMQVPYYYTDFRHYVARTNPVGMRLSDIKEKWGEPMLRDIPYAITQAKAEDAAVARHWYYPHIYLYDSKQDEWMQGVVLDADFDGKIISCAPFDGTHSNVFYHLPFYEDIAAFNLHEYFSMPFKSSRKPDNKDADNFLECLIVGAWIFLVLTLVSVLLIWLLSMALTIRKTTLYICFGVIAIADYIICLTLFTAFSPAWWVLMLAALMMASAQIGVLLAMKVTQCPKCGSRDLDTVEETDHSRKQQTKYPYIVYGATAYGTAYIDHIERTQTTIRPVILHHTCKKCGYEHSEYSEKTTVQTITTCPECGKASLEYEIHDLHVNGLHISGTYHEYCLKCDYTYDVPFSHDVPSSSVPHQAPKRVPNPNARCCGTCCCYNSFLLKGTPDPRTDQGHCSKLERTVSYTDICDRYGSARL